jgi:hypothetical protein
MVLYVQFQEGEWRVLLRASYHIGNPHALQWEPSISCYGDELCPTITEQWLESSTDVLFDTIWSEDGGRFLKMENRYTIAVLPNNNEADTMPMCQWFDFSEFALLCQTGLLNVETRSLLLALWAIPDEILAEKVKTSVRQ